MNIRAGMAGSFSDLAMLQVITIPVIR
jgi:hypothetical protein